MAKTKTATKNMQTETEKTTKKTEKTQNILPSVKDALIYAHDTLYNSRALSKQDFEEVGLAEQALTQWSAFVEELREVSNAYIDLAQDPNAKDAAITAAQGKVWAEWRKVLKQGTEKEFSEKMFVRKADVIFISGLCGTKFQKTATAKVLAHQTATDFRRNIETLIGIRMAGNAILSDADRDVITAYEAAVRTVSSRTDALNGYTRGKNKVQGLNDKLAAQEAVLKKTKASYDKVKMPAEMQEELLKPLTEAIKATNADIKAAKDAIAKAKKTIASNEDSYKKIMEKIRPIAGETFGEYKAEDVDIEETPATEGEKALEQLTPEAAEVAAQTLAAIEKEAEAIADAPAQMEA